MNDTETVKMIYRTDFFSVVKTTKRNSVHTSKETFEIKIK